MSTFYFSISPSNETRSSLSMYNLFFFFFQAEDGIRDLTVTGVQTCALPISSLGLLGRVATDSVRARLAVAQVLAEGRPIAAAAGDHIAGVRRRLNCNGDRRDVWLRVSSSPRRAVEDDRQRASSRAPARADEGARSRRRAGGQESLRNAGKMI